MTVSRWLENTARDIREDGWQGVRNAGKQLYLGGFRRLDWFDRGTNIYDRDWDLLVVLDACRYDLMQEVYEEYEFIESIERFRSVGSSSSEWMCRNFTQEFRSEINKTVHVTGNPNTQESLPLQDFSVLDEVWRYTWDEELGTLLPDPLTDRAIALHRENDPERMIVHYMQPHHPFVQNPIGDGFGESDPWNALERDEVNRDEVWKEYRRNLRYVLEQLPLLLENVDAENAVITSDHGNLLGEYGLYAHPAKVAVSELRTVPWCETTAQDTGSYEPDLSEPADTGTDVVEQRLADLGYV